MKNVINILAIMFLCNTLIAQNAKEAIQNTKQITEGKKNLERDIKELADFKSTLGALKTAVSNKNQVRVYQLKESIINDLTREVRQSGIKADKAKKEIAQSSAEVRSERREINQDKDDSRKGRFDRRDDEKDLARDKANKRDDQRDRRDDIRDFQLQIDRAKNQATLLNQLKEYSFSLESTEGDSFRDRKQSVKRILTEFMKILKEDIAATKAELNEDIRESKEDRRERNDDRNERNEKDTKKRRRNQ